MQTATLTATFARLARSLETMASGLERLERTVDDVNDRISSATTTAEAAGAAVDAVRRAMASTMAPEAPAPTTPREDVVRALAERQPPFPFREGVLLPEEVVEEAPPAPLGVPAPTPALAPAAIAAERLPPALTADECREVLAADLNGFDPFARGPATAEAPAKDAKGKARSRKGGRR